MSMFPIHIAVKRIPCVNYEEAVYWVSSAKEEKEIDEKLKNDKNVVDSFRLR